MNWTMFCFWTGAILILAALIPNEQYNWVSLLYSAIDNFLAKRETKKYPDFVARWKEYCAKEDELEKFYNDKIIKTHLNIKRGTEALSPLSWDDTRREKIKEKLKEYENDLIEYETLFQKLSSELDVGFQELLEEKKKLKINHL